MRRFLVLFLLVVGLVIGCGNSRPSSLLVSIFPFYTSGRNTCTAWSLHQKRALYVTAIHCLGLNTEELVETPSAVHAYGIGDMKAEIFMLFPEDDLAVLHGEHGAPALKLAAEAPKMGDSVSLLGSPLGLSAPLYTIGIVSNPHYSFHGREVMWMQVPVCQGDSGGPFVNAHGRVVSIHQRQTDSPCAPFSLGPTWETLVADVAGLAGN